MREFFFGPERTSFPFWEFCLSASFLVFVDIYREIMVYILEYTISYAYIHFMTGLKPKVGVRYVIGAIPKMKTTYVLGQKKNHTFPLFLESAVILPPKIWHLPGNVLANIGRYINP